MLYRSTSASLFIGAALIYTSPVEAQSAVAPPANEAAQPPASQGQLGDIVVTAQRRSQNIQDIPIAVTALDAATLDRQQITSTLDLSRSVPNMVTANNVLLGTSVTYFLRGTGSTESIATFDLPVGTYVDDVYIARQNANQIALSGIAQVEVLRGPQGTLFGRNTTGGAVSIISKKPDATPSFDGEVGYGSYNRRIADAAVNAPISDSLMVRFSAFFAKDDGYLKNPPTGEHINGEDSKGARIGIRALLSDKLTWDGSAQYIDTEDTHVGVPGVVKAGPEGPFTVYPISATGDLLTGRYTARTCKPTGPVDTWASQGCLYDDVKTALFISNFGLDTGIGKLNAITGYSDIRQSFIADNFANTNQTNLLGGGFGPNYYLGNKGHHKQFSQELKLSGKTLGNSLEYVAGLYYLKENNTTDFVDTVDFAPVIPVIFGDRIMDNSTRSFAVYGQVDYHFNDKLAVQLGGRYTDERKNFGLNGLFFGAPITSADIAAAGVPLSQTVHRFTPRAAIFYKFAPDVLGYVSYTEGFKSGGWNARAFSAAELVPFAPEYVKSYEVGLKTEFLQKRGRVNATLFRADYSNLQVPAIYPGTTDFVTVNAADARVQGLELETSFNVTRDLNVFGNLGLMDSKYSNLTADAVAAGLGPKLQRTPPVTLQLGASQSFHLGDNLVVVSGDGQYTDKFETGPANTLAGHVAPHTTYNAQIAWTIPGGKWTITAECKNCANDVYVVQELLGQLFTNEPRRLMVRAKFKY